MVFLNPDSLASNRNMAPVGAESVVARAKLIAQEFEYGAEDLRKGVKEYLRLMGEFARGPVSDSVLTVLIEVGLQNDGQEMTMIPTYVTGVPNGTEKVCSSREQQRIRSQGSSHLF
jgi:hexokinase